MICIELNKQINMIINCLSIIMKQEVLKYQNSLIHTYNQIDDEVHSVAMLESNYLRYDDWKLQETLAIISAPLDNNIKWIGNDSNASALAFFYCLMNACLSEDTPEQNLFINFKYTVYQQSMQILSFIEQKKMAEFMRLAEYSNNITELLKKSNSFQSLLIKIYTMRKYDTLQTVPYPFNNMKNNLQEIRNYAKIFSFVNVQKITNQVLKISIKNTKFYLIEEKSCYFIVEQVKKTQLKPVSPQKKFVPHQNSSIKVPKSSQKQIQSRQKNNQNRNSLKNKGLPAFLEKSCKKKKQFSPHKKINGSKDEKNNQKSKTVSGNQDNEEKTNLNDKKLGKSIKNKIESFKNVQNMRIKSLEKLEKPQLTKRRRLSSKKTIEGSVQNSMAIDKKGSLTPQKKFNQGLEENYKQKRMSLKHTKGKMWKSRGDLVQEPCQQDLAYKQLQNNNGEIIGKGKVMNDDRKMPKFLAKKKEEDGSKSHINSKKYIVPIFLDKERKGKNGEDESPNTPRQGFFRQERKNSNLINRVEGHENKKSP